MLSRGKPVRAAQAAISGEVADPDRGRGFARRLQDFDADQRILAAADRHQRAVLR